MPIRIVRTTWASCRWKRLSTTPFEKMTPDSAAGVRCLQASQMTHTTRTTTCRADAGFGCVKRPWPWKRIGFALARGPSAPSDRLRRVLSRWHRQTTTSASSPMTEVREVDATAVSCAATEEPEVSCTDVGLGDFCSDCMEVDTGYPPFAAGCAAGEPVVEPGVLSVPPAGTCSGYSAHDFESLITASPRFGAQAIRSVPELFAGQLDSDKLSWSCLSIASRSRCR